jgi:hypothetical protein
VSRSRQTTTPLKRHTSHAACARDLFGSHKIETCFCACTIQSVNNWEHIPGTAQFKQILNLQRCNFMIIETLYVYIIYILAILRSETIRRSAAGLVLLCSG